MIWLLLTIHIYVNWIFFICYLITVQQISHARFLIIIGIQIKATLGQWSDGAGVRIGKTRYLVFIKSITAHVGQHLIHQELLLGLKLVPHSLLLIRLLWHQLLKAMTLLLFQFIEHLSLYKLRVITRWKNRLNSCLSRSACGRFL